MNEKNSTILQLPFGVVGRVDVGRLIRELAALENFLQAAAVREPGTALKLPKTSRLMDEIIQTNGINALLEPDRRRLREFLESVRDNSPMMHMSFSADPPPLFTKKLITWLRQEIHPLVLLQVGLQPGIGAGTVVRTTNKYFDFSLRERFYKNHDILIQKLREMPDNHSEKAKISAEETTAETQTARPPADSERTAQPISKIPAEPATDESPADVKPQTSQDEEVKVDVRETES